MSTNNFNYPNCQCPKLYKNKLKELFKKPTLCDVVLITTIGNKIPAHKCVLASQSEYFTNMLTGKLEENIEIENMDNYILQLLIDFLDTGKIDIDIKNVEEIFDGANLLQLHNVQNICIDFFKATVVDENCIIIKKIADSKNITILTKFCSEYIETNFKSISERRGFLNLNVNELLDILEKDSLKVDKEESVYRDVIRWIKHDEDYRIHYLLQLMSMVRLQFISPEFVNKIIENESLIKSNKEFYKLVRRMYTDFTYKYGDHHSTFSNSKPRNYDKDFDHSLPFF